MKTQVAFLKARWIKVIGFALMGIVLIAAATNVEVNRDAPGRSGPGSFYDLKVLIPAGSKLTVSETQKSWLKVSFENEQVWISENALAEKDEPSDNPFSGMSFVGARASASPATISAAIKGFWTRYTYVDKSMLAEVPIDGYSISPVKVEAFEKERADAVSREKLMNRYKLQKQYRKPRMPYIKEKQLGYTIASSVAEGTLLDNEKVLTYVYSVGWYIADATERPDIRFIFLILDTDKINAVACPGGYILLTKGVLNLIENEAELAALLAHEMSHIIAGHGTRELEDESNKIGMAASDAFARLDNEKGATKMEQELGAIATRATSISLTPKLDKYEFEADAMALRYMARSGYDLDGHFRLLTKLKKKHDTEVDIFDLNYRNHPDFDKRIRNSEKEMDNYKKYSGQTFSAAFTENMVF